MLGLDTLLPQPHNPDKGNDATDQANGTNGDTNTDASFGARGQTAVAGGRHGCDAGRGRFAGASDGHS